MRNSRRHIPRNRDPRALGHQRRAYQLRSVSRRVRDRERCRCSDRDLETLPGIDLRRGHLAAVHSAIRGRQDAERGALAECRSRRPGSHAAGQVRPEHDRDNLGRPDPACWRLDRRLCIQHSRPALDKFHPQDRRLRSSQQGGVVEPSHARDAGDAGTRAPRPRHLLCVRLALRARLGRRVVSGSSDWQGVPVGARLSGPQHAQDRGQAARLWLQPRGAFVHRHQGRAALRNVYPDARGFPLRGRRGPRPLREPPARDQWFRDRLGRWDVDTDQCRDRRQHQQ